MYVNPFLLCITFVFPQFNFKIYDNVIFRQWLLIYIFQFAFYLFSLDIDECKLSVSPVCPHKCVNTEGSYKCACNDGYKLEHDKDCVDINECSDISPCSHNCTNTKGSFVCGCAVGYRLQDDGVSCEGKNPFICMVLSIPTVVLIFFFFLHFLLY